MKNLFYTGLFLFILPACNNRNLNNESSGIPTENGREINDKTIKDNRTYQERNNKAEADKNIDPGTELRDDSMGNTSRSTHNK